MRDWEKHRNLPRLDREMYQGLARVHWVLSIVDRRTGWLDERFHERFREVMLHTFARYRLACPVYCLMPDHMHLLWFGASAEAVSDQIVAMEFFRKFLKGDLGSYEIQRPPYDHVLIEGERQPNEVEATGTYILENPVRRGLVNDCQYYPFLGAVVPGYPAMVPFEPDFWERFWRIFERVMER